MLLLSLNFIPKCTNYRFLRLAAPVFYEVAEVGNFLMSPFSTVCSQSSNPLNWLSFYAVWFCQRPKICWLSRENKSRKLRSPAEALLPRCVCVCVCVSMCVYALVRGCYIGGARILWSILQVEIYVQDVILFVCGLLLEFRGHNAWNINYNLRNFSLIKLN